MYCFKREPRNDRKIWILQYCPKEFCPGLVRRLAQSKVRLNEFGSPNTFYPSAFNLYFHKYLKNVSVILISDWILSKRFYIKSTDVSICPLRNLYWDTFVRKNENSFKEGTIYVLGHTLQYFGWVYKQAINIKWQLGRKGILNFILFISISFMLMCRSVSREKCSALKIIYKVKICNFSFLGDT